MKKSYRIKRDKDFSEIFKTGQNLANRKFVIYKLPSNQHHFRVGLSVSKKLGNAVVRNRIKRLMRHVLITHRDRIMTEDFVLIARKGVEELAYSEVEKNLLHLLRLAKLYQEERDCETKD